MHSIQSILKLGYAPMTLFEFNHYAKDDDVVRYLSSVSLYIIARRNLPVMSLLDSSTSGIKLSVTMSDVESNLEIMMLQKDNDGLFGTEGIDRIGTGSNIKDQPTKFQSISLFRKSGDESINVLNASFDRLIHLHSNGQIRLRVKGDITSFLSYTVLYVGSCTKEHIFKRFKSHHALQRVLVEEEIIPPNYDKANELLLLPFGINSEVISNLTMSNNEDDFVDALMGNFRFGHQEISLDCEKALVKAMSPRYNITKFSKYPKSSDGLAPHQIDRVVFEIRENILLCYDGENRIRGDINGEGATKIIIDNSSEFHIMNPK